MIGHLGIKQTGTSDCFVACLASLTGIPVELFPSYTMKDRDATGQWNDCLRVLEAHGFMMFNVFPPRRPAAYAIAHGRSPRGEWLHSVITLDGEPIFDPHPTGDMLAGSPESYTVVIRLQEPVQREQGESP